ncbi:LLM class flavin-dependent oxidoreductase [Phaeobacter sp. 22II1-1F12B]|uniref:LLM class flavin-dependent oxidoreductase n=1 Tax=Phaeobacter sp. 22II1-1F12B TaxID=1317111 RepID=UPI000B520197|nr:LLM class flavin-dependent oxidoreductase [Phaeobacter sp. 22II1-1F12B]OWU79138.1 luciferase [Phaeobacter sp. 22II1-1F12B]
MRFSIAVNMGRLDPTTDMRQIADEALELVKIADQGGFDIVWTAEHHTIELTVSPNPFQLLSHWGAHTKNIRLGTAVVAAPYWNPIRLAGEAALCDILTDGRLELGLGRGAYQYEFDRMAGGMPQQEGGKHLREIIPVVKALWAGEYAHEGELWNFPATTSVPKPLQKSVPMWIAARDENTFQFAADNGCNIMSTALRKPFAEVVDLQRKFDAVTKDLPKGQLQHATLRSTCLFEDKAGEDTAYESVINYGRAFENLFKGTGEVKDGYPEAVDFETVANRDEYDRESLLENMMLGSPEQVIEKLERYKAAGVDQFIYGASFFVPHQNARRSLELFCDKVIPHFRKQENAASPEMAGAK